MWRAISCRLIVRVILGAMTVAIACMPGTALAQRAGARPANVPFPGPSRIVRAPIVERRPIRPIFPIFPPIGFRSIDEPFFGFGLGLRYRLIWWEDCGPFWGWLWGSNCYQYESPVDVFDGDGRELPQLYLKDGTVYDVTDYWLVNDQLHFTTLDTSGVRWVEHTIELVELDLQKTVDVSNLRDFNFVLRNEPLQDYLKDYPGVGASRAAPPQAPPPKP
jgi:hypothetical protein